MTTGASSWSSGRLRELGIIRTIRQFGFRLTGASFAALAGLQRRSFMKVYTCTYFLSRVVVLRIAGILLADADGFL